MWTTYATRNARATAKHVNANCLHLPRVPDSQLINGTFRDPCASTYRSVAIVFLLYKTRLCRSKLGKMYLGMRCDRYRQNCDAGVAQMLKQALHVIIVPRRRRSFDEQYVLGQSYRVISVRKRLKLQPLGHARARTYGNDEVCVHGKFIMT
ncbi:hypothetical protein CPB85DRAFT_1255930 [Mucidula mucida]|nr:hypothetical protein CPB85DRAFT_1255930 [Mucidula mucida]